MISSSASKPFFGFGWIETIRKVVSILETYKLLNHSSASAGLKQTGKGFQSKPNYTSKPFFGFGWIETKRLM